MIVKTKKYRLTTSKYMRIALWHIFRKQWWVSILFTIPAIGLYYKAYRISSVVVMALLLLYVLFWWAQIYGLTQMEDNKLMFERLFYELSRDRIVIFLNSKHGMPIDWKKIIKAREGKDHFILFISTAQFVYLPFSIFNGNQQINLVRMLLKNKKLIA